MAKDWKQATHRVRLSSIAEKVPEPLRATLKEAAYEEEFIKRRPVLSTIDNELTADEALKGLTGVRPGERAVLRYVSTRDVDRDHEVLDPAGAILDQFLLAPQVLWAHDYTGPPTAKAEWIYPNDYGLRSKTLYAETERAEEVWQLIKGGFLATASVGFLPLKRVFHDDPEWAETVQRYNTKWETDLEKAGCDVITTKWLLLEYSDVPVPANPNALITAIAKGELMVGDNLLEQLGVPDPDETTDIEEGNPAERPFPNEHSCRLKEPSLFQEDSFRRTSREHEGKKYSIIMGRLKGETTITEQAYRYGKDVWEAAQARSHCKSHDGSFEAASGESDSCALPVLRRIAKPKVELAKPTAVIRRARFDKPIIIRPVKIAPTREQIAAQAAQDALNQLRGKV